MGEEHVPAVRDQRVKLRHHLGKRVPETRHADLAAEAEMIPVEFVVLPGVDGQIGQQVGGVG